MAGSCPTARLAMRFEFAIKVAFPSAFLWKSSACNRVFLYRNMEKNMELWRAQLPCLFFLPGGYAGNQTIHATLTVQISPLNSRSTIDPLFSLGPCWLNILAKSRKPDRKVWGLKMGEFRWTGTAYILLRASYFLTSCWTEDLSRSNFHSFAFTPEAWSLWLFF